jgi:threonyl-tRNA synthetase
MTKVNLTLPDGKILQVEKGCTCLQAAASIGQRLAQAAVCAKLDDSLVDLSKKIDTDAKFSVLTFDSKEGREVFNHSCAHVLAQAVTRLWPGTGLGVGPAVEEGFYYDFDKPEPFTLQDLQKIQDEMRKIVASDYPVIREEESKAQARKRLQGQGAGKNKFRLQILEELPQDTVSFYKQGEFEDLCRGPHAPTTGAIKAFALLKVAGAYWKGDANNLQLQRIYGIAYPSQKQLDAHVALLEEASKRDHKKLGPALDLFTFSELVGPGLPLWTPKGTILRELLDDYVWELRKQIGYEKVEIPHITKKELYQTSGHWDKYKDDLFRITTREGHEFAMKPMNCPHHTQIYARKLWSYRQLPQRYANTTTCYRDEQTGELNGLSRVRAFTQDDAHVFCRYSQVKGELAAIWDSVVEPFYNSFGFKLRVRLSLHDPLHPEKYLGGKDRWKEAEATLRELASERKAEFFEAIGEAAFYGPKLDFLVKDSLGREWQVATIQLDMNQPERFDLYCIGEDGGRERIVMIHAAIMGSIDRFLSILIEHTAGAFPLWLSPVQVSILPVADRHTHFSQELAKNLREHGIRVQVDDSQDKTGAKIRSAQLQKVNYMLVVGEKEMESANLAVRSRDGNIEESVEIPVFIKRLKNEISQRK